MPHFRRHAKVGGNCSPAIQSQRKSALMGLRCCRREPAEAEAEAEAAVGAAVEVVVVAAAGVAAAG